MFKRIFLLLSVSFLVFFASLYFYHLQNVQFEKYLSDVKNIESDLESAELSQIDSINVETWSNNKLDNKAVLEEMIANNLSDVNYIIDENHLKDDNWKNNWYKKLYLSSMKKKNTVLAIKAIKNILKETEYKDIWYVKIIDLYIKIWDFNAAEEYSKKLLKLKWTPENLQKYLYIKFQNTNFFSDDQVNEIKYLVKSLHEKKVINAWDYTFYSFLIDLLSKRNIDDLETNLELISKEIIDPIQKNLIFEMQQDLQTYKSYKWSPDYYFKTLIALDLLKFGYFWLAKNIAQNTYLQDNSYILAQQILWYSYFFMWNFEESIKYFKNLLKIDLQNKNEYNFFLWVSYYRIQKSQDSLLYLSQLDSNYPYYLDVLRYRLLSRIQLKDVDYIIPTIQEITQFDLSFIDYYNIFKYLFFECDDCYKENLHLLTELIKKCYKDTDSETEYVCWYWKSNLYRNFRKFDYAVKYYKLLTKYFQDAYIFHNLGRYYEYHKDFEQAKIYFMKELLYTTDPEKRQELENKIKSLFLKK